MEKKPRHHLTRDDWVRGALALLRERGVGGVRVLTLARRLSITRGSFYWHFKDLTDLLDCLLDYWERELTDAIIDAAETYHGPPEERILNLMHLVIEKDAAVYDHAISVWASGDPKANEVFERTLRKRFDFTSSMFKEAGFPANEASIRGRLLVAYMMGESATALKRDPYWKATVRKMHKVLTDRMSRLSKTKS